MPESNAKLLIIEDDPIVRQFLKGALMRQNFDIQEAGNGKAGLDIAAEWGPDVVLLDLGLPDMDGIEVATRMRGWLEVPIIVLSSREQEETKVAALDAGADDYLTKPIGVAELQARLRVALRHIKRNPAPAEDAQYVVDGLQVDLVRRQVSLHGKDIHLTPTEFKLLTFLIRNAGKVMRHRELLQNVWGPQYDSEVNYLRIYIKHLRDKIEDDPANPRFILSEPRIGYRFVAGPEIEGSA